MSTDIEALREALRWCIHRLDGEALRREGFGQVPTKFFEVHKLAFGTPSRVEPPTGQGALDSIRAANRKPQTELLVMGRYYGWMLQ